MRAGELVVDLILPSAFIVDRTGSSPQIVCYLPRQDILTLLPPSAAITRQVLYFKMLVRPDQSISGQ
jgi:hypothetical protein